MKRLGMAVLLALALASARAQDGGEARLQAAIKTEVFDGNLKGAIEQYKKLIDARGTSRAVKARALLQLGGCYEKQGDAEARRTFERLLKDYSDQAEIAALARTRLAALGFASAKPVDMLMRRIWTGPEIDMVGPPSPDGRYITYIDKETFDLGVHDLTTGVNRRLTNRDLKAKEFEMGLDSAWSPDGTRIAYDWLNPQGFMDLRVIDVDGSNAKVFYSEKDTQARNLAAWFPDGKSVLATLYKKGSQGLLARIFVNDGSVQSVKELDRRIGSAALSPDGRFVAFVSFKPDNQTDSDIFLMPVAGGDAVALDTGPSAERLFTWDSDGRSVLFLSDRSGTADLWRIPVANGKQAGDPELIKSEFGLAHSLGASSHGSLFFYPGKTKWDVFSTELDLASGKVVAPPRRINGRHIGDSTSPVWSPNGERLAYLAGSGILNPSGKRILCVWSPKDGGEKQFLLGDQIPDWHRLSWSPDGRSVSGFVAKGKNLYHLLKIDATSGEVAPAAVPDLPLDWVPDLKTVYLRRESPGNPAIVARSLESGGELELYRSAESGTIIMGLGRPLSPDGKWLAVTEGKLKQPSPASFRLMLIPTTGGSVRELVRITEPEKIYHVGWTPDSKSVVYSMRDTSKSDGSPKLMSLFLIPLEGGTPRKLDLALPSIGHMSFHPDGRQMAFTSMGADCAEVWVLENIPPLKAAAR